MSNTFVQCLNTGIVVTDVHVIQQDNFITSIDVIASNMSDEIHYKILNSLQDNPQISQRDLAKELGVSLGKANYCLRALIERGWVKARNFQKSDNKKGYAYLLTRKGIEEKARVTVRFLRHKINEYENLKREISIMQQEIASQAARGERGPARDAIEDNLP